VTVVLTPVAAVAPEVDVLVLTQKDGDVVEIGPNIRIMVCQSRRGVVRIAIDAPREVQIRRLPAPGNAPDGSDGTVEDLRDRPVEVVILPPSAVTTRRVRPAKTSKT
jgi:carbon storage regulator